MIGGVAAPGLAILDTSGNVIDQNFPVLDVNHVSTALRLDDGRFVIAGLFTTVNGMEAHRLARLNTDRTLDTTFTTPLEPWQFVDDLQLDPQGRLLIAGQRNFVLETMTNPQPTGLQRLLENGSRDPAFQVYGGPSRRVFVEPGGTLLVGLPPQRFDADGQVLVPFEEASIWYLDNRAFDPDHRMIRLANGSVVGPWHPFSDPARLSLARWESNGLRDYSFEAIIGDETLNRSIQATCLMPDGSILVSTILHSFVNQPPLSPEAARQLVRIPPDADSRLQPIGIDGGLFSVRLETRSDRSYEIRRRPSLNSPHSDLVTSLEGDGYVSDVSTPADLPMLFLELRQQ
jgi:hypothetical protein